MLLMQIDYDAASTDALLSRLVCAANIYSRAASIFVQAPTSRLQEASPIAREEGCRFAPLNDRLLIANMATSRVIAD